MHPDARRTSLSQNDRLLGLVSLLPKYAARRPVCVQPLSAVIQGRYHASVERSGPTFHICRRYDGGRQVAVDMGSPAARLQAIKDEDFLVAEPFRDLSPPFLKLLWVTSLFLCPFAPGVAIPDGAVVSAWPRRAEHAYDGVGEAACLWKNTHQADECVDWSVFFLEFNISLISDQAQKAIKLNSLR